MQLGSVIVLFSLTLGTETTPLSQTAPATDQSNSLRKLLELHEGRSYTVYRCTAGFRTIGVGHNLDAHETQVEIARLEQNGATRAEVERWLSEDIERVEKQLEERFGNEEWFRKLSEVRRCVLKDMAFNLGIEGLSKFKKMLTALRASNFDEASKEMLDSAWAKQVGKRATRLAEMMRTDKFPKL